MRMTKEEKKTIAPMVIAKITFKESGLSCLPNFELEHAGSFNCRTPPQSNLLPPRETSLALLKTPPVGTSPSSWLKDRFKLLRPGRSSRSFGIIPDKLLWERSRILIDFIELNE
ncbi:hypothetical protein TorRG33x02_091020 [Trema orientale]|uniref:Uncharacterized protein n=1 Tax=Trema orientale TaxID=63057 RepID=A0A2P5FBN6_TREOI|nr:hypothetical protein TorRG33x02_091020 [Trema orientale]